MKIAIILSILLISQSALAQNNLEPIAFANAIFTGTVNFNNTQQISNKRFCHVARRLKFPKSIPLEVEGGLQGESPFLSYGIVNGKAGVGFYIDQYENVPVGVSYLSSPNDKDPAPRGRQAVACGLFSVNTYLQKVNDVLANTTHTLYFGCQERNNGRRRGNFYLCYQRNYTGVTNRFQK